MWMYLCFGVWALNANVAEITKLNEREWIRQQIMGRRETGRERERTKETESEEQKNEEYTNWKFFRSQNEESPSSE